MPSTPANNEPPLRAPTYIPLPTSKTSPPVEIGRYHERLTHTILSPSISKHHCTILYSTQYASPAIIDHKSLNGIAVNGKRIQPGGVEVPLKAGDVVCLGGCGALKVGVEWKGWEASGKLVSSWKMVVYDVVEGSPPTQGSVQDIATSDSSIKKDFCVDRIQQEDLVLDGVDVGKRKRIEIEEASALHGTSKSPNFKTTPKVKPSAGQTVSPEIGKRKRPDLERGEFIQRSHGNTSETEAKPDKPVTVSDRFELGDSVQTQLIPVPSPRVDPSEPSSGRLKRTRTTLDVSHFESSSKPLVETAQRNDKNNNVLIILDSDSENESASPPPPRIQAPITVYEIPDTQDPVTPAVPPRVEESEAVWVLDSPTSPIVGPQDFLRAGRASQVLGVEGLERQGEEADGARVAGEGDQRRSVEVVEVFDGDGDEVDDAAGLVVEEPPEPIIVPSVAPIAAESSPVSSPATAQVAQPTGGQTRSTPPSQSPPPSDSPNSKTAKNSTPSNEEFTKNFIQKNLADQITCSICYDVMIAPHSVTCGHSYCGPCLDDWFKRGKRTCPQCRSYISKQPIYHVALQNIIDVLAPQILSEEDMKFQAERMEVWKVRKRELDAERESKKKGGGGHGGGGGGGGGGWFAPVGNNLGGGGAGAVAAAPVVGALDRMFERQRRQHMESLARAGFDVRPDVPADYRNRIELIQDFQFPEASLKIKFTPDRKHIITTGVYKPQMRVYDLDELAIKFERHNDCENVAFEILSDDWTKTVLLQADRSVEFHSQFGIHYKTRIPKFGRDMTYYHPTCDLFLVGSSNEVWRMNLEQGRFLNSFTTSSPALNTARQCNAHGLLGFGGEDGFVEFWHPLDRKKLARLDVGGWMTDPRSSQRVGNLERFPEITAFEFNDDGLSFAVGTATGHVLLYDLRKPEPITVSDHQYGLPIKSIKFHPTGNVLSADSKVVRIWNKDSGKLFTAVEPPYDINDICIQDDTGILFIANEGVDIQSYYIPELGPAPKWCPFLDNLTEELEENPEGMTLYDDYKFVSRKELSRLGLDHLIGTNLLKAYMHGFFVDLRLYFKAKAIANPFEYEEHRRKLIASKLEKERKTRINAGRKLPKINSALAKKIQDGLAEDEEADSDDGKKKNKKKKVPLQLDDRFSQMFEDEDFQIDESTVEWRLHHPSEASQPRVPMEDFQKIDDGAPSDSEEASDASDDNDSDDDLGTSSARIAAAQAAYKTTKSSKAPAMYELRDGVKFNDPKSRKSSAVSRDSTLAERLTALSDSEETSNRGRRGEVVQALGGGNKAVVFKPRVGRMRDGQDAEGREEGGGGEKRRKRGVGELGLKRLDGGGFRGGRGGSRGGGRGRRRGGGRGRGGRD
ncbi:Nucleolar protein 10 [Chytridiales sp. JEL 0842]|nr:Nucleolar protein 10 [Chytridiales sp. JEL 0842]